MERTATVAAPRIAILGGGTAGWMAACLMAQAWPAAAITVIESPSISIVGVGEGSTPQLRALMVGLGLVEAEWMPAAHATYKAGIIFRGWSGSTGPASYVHPFPNAVDLHSEPAFHAATRARRLGVDVSAHPDAFFLNSWLALNGRAPFPMANFPFDAAYGYHFDANLIGDVLRRAALVRGVVHREAQVTRVQLDPAGEIGALLLDSGEELGADLFVDASGFRSVIAQQALGVRFLPFDSNLFNDRAVVIATPADRAARACTEATALHHGWAWRIPLTARTGNGYVYASRYVSCADAERELRLHLGVGDDVPARHLKMHVGRVAESWSRNCLVIGLAQGFLEPLEATALHLVQATVEGFIDAWNKGGFTPAFRNGFNGAIARRYESIRDYIVAHYRLNQRRDTDYWRENAGHDRLSDSLKSLITCWFTGGDIVAEVERQEIGSYYAPLSWGCLFAGYGVFPKQHLRPAPASAAPEFADFLERCGRNFPMHSEALTMLQRSAAA